MMAVMLLSMLTTGYPPIHRASERQAVDMEVMRDGDLRAGPAIRVLFEGHGAGAGG